MSDRFQFLSVLFVPLLLLVSCIGDEEGNFIEIESRDYLAAKQKMREGDYVQALEYFHRVIDEHSYSPESHLEAGVIYLQQEDEPVIAIYHLNQYLQQKPEGREAALVSDLILSAKKQFAASLPGNPLKNTVSRMELLESISSLKRQLEENNKRLLVLEGENRALREQLTGTRDTMRGFLNGEDLDASAAVATTPSDGVRSEPIAIAPEIQAQVEQVLPVQGNELLVPEKYEVQSGDSLYAISVRFYGNSEHIQSIFQANRNVLKSVDDLKPGQVLVLPQ